MLLLHWTGNCYGHKIIETVSIWLNLRHSSCDTVKKPILIRYYWYCCLQLLSHSHIKNECVRLHVWVSEWAGKHKRVSCRTTPMKIDGFCFIFIFILNLTSPVHSKYVCIMLELTQNGLKTRRSLDFQFLLPFGCRKLIGLRGFLYFTIRTSRKTLPMKRPKRPYSTTTKYSCSHNVPLSLKIYEICRNKFTILQWTLLFLIEMHT